MKSKEGPLLPTWAPRLTRREIENLYKTSGKGIVDERQVDEVGYGLFARCKSMLAVQEAMNGRIACPNCEALILRKTHVSKEARLRCGECGWTCSWKKYRATFDSGFLNAGNMDIFCREFVKKFPSAANHGEKLVLIDTLIHRIHFELAGGTRPGANAFIEGEITDIAAFLDRLTYGDHMPEDVRRTREAWRKRVGSGPNFWSSQIGNEPQTSK